MKQSRFRLSVCPFVRLNLKNKATDFDVFFYISKIYNNEIKENGLYVQC